MNKLKRNIKVDYIYRFFSCFDITAAIWILYLGYKGMSLVQVGLLESIFHITGIIFEIPTGAIADILGRKKVIILGRICSILSSIMMLSVSSFLGFAIAFVIQAFSYNLNSGSEEALVYDSLKEIGEEESYTKISGRLNLIIEIAQGLAVFIGGILAEFSFGLSYIVAIAFGICSLIISMKFTEIDKFEESKSINLIKHFKESFMVLKGDRVLRNLLIYFPVIFTFSTTIFFYGQQHFANIGLTKTEISIIFLINGIVSGIGAILSDKLDKILKNKGFVIIPLGMGIAIILFSVFRGISSIIMFCLIRLFTAMLYPIGSNKVNELIPSEKRATIISVDSMMFSLGMIILFPLAGYIGDVANLKISFLSIGVVTVIIGVAALIKCFGRKPRA